MADTRVAVVGLGYAGASLHLPALQGLADVRITGGFDVDPERRAEAARRFGVPTFESLDEMLDGASPDVLVVATPPERHAADAVAGLRAGAHVICEKPLATSVGEADRMLSVAAECGRHLAVNHEFREMPVFRHIRDRLGEPGVGRLVFAQLWQLMDLPPWQERGWRQAMLTGTLYEAGIHLIDYAVYVFGERPVAVTASISSCGQRTETSDAVALVTMEFSEGRLAQVVQNRLCRGDTQYFEARLDAEATSLRASFGGRVRVSAGLLRSKRPHMRLEYGATGLAWREVGHARHLLVRNPADPAAFATGRLLARTLEAFRTGGSPPASGREGRDVLEVIAACYHSATAGQRVVVADAAEALRGMTLLGMAGV